MAYASSLQTVLPGSASHPAEAPLLLLRLVLLRGFVRPPGAPRRAPAPHLLLHHEDGNQGGSA